MNPEDYVSYPIALALKKAGFDWECDHFYEHRLDPNKARISASGVYGEWKNIDAFKHNFNAIDDNRHEQLLIPHCSAPTLWQAQKWLREEWGIHINVCIYSDYSTDADGKVCDRWDFWGFDLYAVSGGKQIEDGDGEYDSYESALSAGIAAALELIEKEGE